jgi:hypothetical protein
MRSYEFISKNLHESKSADLYHGTSLSAAEEILSDNTLRTGDGSNSDEANASLTRDFSIALRFATQYRPSVIFVLDQLKLSQALGRKLRPVDHSNSEPESEEASSVDINNISRYIKQIILLRSYENTEYEEADEEQYPLIFNNPKTVVRGDMDYGTTSTARQAGQIDKQPRAPREPKKYVDYSQK